MTMHSSKGLEFDIILPGWEEDYFRIKINRRKGQKGLEEERRLAYIN